MSKCFKRLVTRLRTCVEIQDERLERLREVFQIREGEGKPPYSLKSYKTSLMSLYMLFTTCNHKPKSKGCYNLNLNGWMRWKDGLGRGWLFLMDNWSI